MNKHIGREDTGRLPGGLSAVTSPTRVEELQDFLEDAS